MSSHDEGFAPVQEEDRLARGTILAVAVVAVIVTIVSVVIAGAILGGEDEAGPRPRPVVAPVTIGTVEQTLIRETERGQVLRAEQRAVLGQYGWVDRDAGVVRIPIDVAMDIAVARAQREDERGR